MSGEKMAPLGETHCIYLVSNEIYEGIIKTISGFIFNHEQFQS